VLAWLVAVSGSYVMNCYITFAAESGRQLRWRAYGAFVASGPRRGVIINTAVLVLVSRWPAGSGGRSCWPSRRASWSISRFRISSYSARARRAGESGPTE